MTGFNYLCELKVKGKNTPNWNRKYLKKHLCVKVDVGGVVE